MKEAINSVRTGSVQSIAISPQPSEIRSLKIERLHSEFGSTASLRNPLCNSYRLQLEIARYDVRFEISISLLRMFREISAAFVIPEDRRC
ncbi:uncharacterized protein J3R85_020291 [Psidium guajava]|nr:uncharacterized protein J3R85_020291 [Psidium guajava]